MNEKSSVINEVVQFWSYGNFHSMSMVVCWWCLGFWEALWGVSASWFLELAIRNRA